MAREPTDRRLAFGRALYLTVAWAFVPIVWLYAVGFPTRDLRARLPFLLSGPPAVVGAFVVLGLVTVSFTGAKMRASWPGVVAGAVLSYLVLASGMIGRVLPADYESPARPSFVVISAVVALGILWRERQRVRAMPREDRERAA